MNDAFEGHITFDSSVRSVRLEVHQLTRHLEGTGLESEAHPLLNFGDVPRQRTHGEHLNALPYPPALFARGR